MKLDVEMQLLPHGWYVNRTGAPTRLSSETGLFYCGRNVMPENSDCDGFCGPTNGPNCRACSILGSQFNRRYKNIWPNQV